MTKVVLITGAGSGIGRATAAHFATKGWQVVATVKDGARAGGLETLANVFVLELDVTDEAMVASVSAAVVERFGKLDVLVNNAGYYQMGPLEATTMAQVRAQFETNVFGLVAVTKAFLPTFREQRSGVIVNLSSISAETGYPFTSVYGASKAAVLSLTEALNVELSGFGVTAKAVLPGTHATRIFTKVDEVDAVPDAYRPLLQRFFGLQSSLKGSPPENAARVVYGAATDRRPGRVRYFAGPDAVSIPRMKRLLGESAYFRLTKWATLHASASVLRLMSPQGSAEVEADLRLFEKV